jgi:hypothetical protein
MLAGFMGLAVVVVAAATVRHGETCATPGKRQRKQ